MGSQSMAFLRDFARRVGQLDLLLRPPAELRRRHQRYAVNVPIEITVGGRTMMQNAVDISSGGVLVSPGFTGNLREPIFVTVHGLLRDAPARIVGLRPDGVAIQFDSEDHGTLLTSWLVQASQDTRTTH